VARDITNKTNMKTAKSVTMIKAVESVTRNGLHIRRQHIADKTDHVYSPVIAGCYTVVQPYTVMIKPIDTLVTYSAVLCICKTIGCIFIYGLYIYKRQCYPMGYVQYISYAISHHYSKQLELPLVGPLLTHSYQTPLACQVCVCVFW